jgi:biopolymer transport protein TolQ
MLLTYFLASLGPGEITGLLIETTLLGKLVLIILFVLSILSWAVMIDKARVLSIIRKGHADFWDICNKWLDKDITEAEARQWCEDNQDLPLSNMWIDTHNLSTVQSVRRSSERIAYAETEGLERYLIILSTTVTISPFLGLMGTVWGIMQAFWDMSAMRSANLTVVAPGIAEALITTIAGLSAAIPAVVFYNMFVRKIDLIGNEMERLRTIMEEEAQLKNEGSDNRIRPVNRPDLHDGERIR